MYVSCKYARACDRRRQSVAKLVRLRPGKAVSARASASSLGERAQGWGAQGTEHGVTDHEAVPLLRSLAARGDPQRALDRLPPTQTFSGLGDSIGAEAGGSGWRALYRTDMRAMTQPCLRVWSPKNCAPHSKQPR